MGMKSGIPIMGDIIMSESPIIGMGTKKTVRISVRTALFIVQKVI